MESQILSKSHIVKHQLNLKFNDTFEYVKLKFFNSSNLLD